MRDVSDILDELRNHPDVLNVEIWTINDCIEVLIDNLDYQLEEGDFDPRDYYENTEEIIDDIRDIIDRDTLEDAVWNYYNFLYENHSVEWPDLSEMEFWKGWSREIKLKKVLE